MKKLNVLFHAIAFVIAIGGAFASASSDLIPGYIRISNPLQPCQPSVPCNGTGPACRDASGNQVFDGSVMNATSCGVSLKHQP